MSRPIAKPDSALQHLARISLLIYPLIAHIAIMLDQVIWAAGYLLVVVYFNSLKIFSQHRYVGQGFAAFLCAVLVYSFFHPEIDTWMIYLPPVLIPAWLAFVFIGSVRMKRALISQIAERIEGEPLDQQQLRYTRRLTSVWGAVFVLMVCEAIVLAVWAPFDVWSWWVHVGNYLVVAILFLSELVSRRLLIGRRARVGQMFRVLLQIDWHRYKDDE